ncbi:RlmE family RNA methyltransferase [Candidatus Absconditicoccus praedator]|uniref:RlmE family RNA methyltransferase n=1 Tax=Candidatus Absconditicoccus praedator TaxID=2735562 RepID=UPI001E5EDCD5|nr:RlmE family RNA methyltransferase [Candidatus Absconditicoccus praedator]UFX83023.1 RlmE family RNA methyltransferase [Candidatus Absconditicoccus praedator]
MYNPYDYYFKKAKKTGYKARSAFKLEEIDNKFHIFNKNTKNILDIGCYPGSWIQYIYGKLNKLNVQNYKIVGFDLMQAEMNMEGVFLYQQDIKDKEGVSGILENLGLGELDVIVSDMAPNTIGMKDIDSMKSVDLLEESFYVYQSYLKQDGKFVMKVFMGPGFEEFLGKLKKIYGGKNIKTYKPSSTRKSSKETYLIKI